MKKVSLVLGMVLAASFAMAQTTVINQTTSGNGLSAIQNATVSQSGVSSVNVTQVAEKLVTHQAVVDQSGVAGGNIIVISQSATDNPKEENIGLNKTNAIQNGGSNQTYQTQISGDWTHAGMDFLSNQQGIGNIATQYSKKTSADFDLFQSGTGNISKQATTGEKTGVLVGDVRQIGTSNDATQLFHGENVRWAGGIINQEGTLNIAFQEFTGSAAGFWNEPSKADIIQRNSDNYAYQSQVGSGSYQKTEQYGTSNDAYLYSNGNFNTAYARQDGATGFIKIEQKQTTTDALIAADGNLAKVYQNGDGSEAYVFQDGFRNKVLGLNGDDYATNNNDSYLNVSQTGDDNLVRSQQTATGAAETVVQIGMNNTAIVNQY